MNNRTKTPNTLVPVKNFKTGAEVIRNTQQRLKVDKDWNPILIKDQVMTESEMQSEFSAFGSV